MKILSAISLLLCATGASSAQQTVPCEIIVPVLDANKQVLTATVPDGQSYPVFREAPPSKLVSDARRELETSFAQQVLRLDHYARNLMIAKRTEAHRNSEEWQIGRASCRERM